MAGKWWARIDGTDREKGSIGRKRCKASRPDPTVIGTLGWLLLLQGRRTAARLLLRGLWAVPLAWCAITAATLGTMGEWSALVPLAAALLALVAARR